MAIQTNELAAVVTRHIMKELPDGLEKANPLWYHFMNGGKKKISGGTTIDFPIKLLKNDSSAFISGTGAVVDTTPSQQLQYGVLNWKYTYFSANFTLEDFTVAGGKEQIVNFIQSKKDGALADFYRDMSTAVWGSSSAAPLQFEGIEDIVAGSGTAYAGLTDTDYTDATQPYLPYISTESILSYQAISDLITQSRARTQKDGGSQEMIGLINPYLFNKMLSILQGQQVFSNSAQTVKSGFQSFNINGVDFYMDVDSPGTGNGTTGDNHITIIPKDVLSFSYKYGIDAASPFDSSVQLPNQPILSIQKYLAGNVICNNRRRISVNKSLV